jgi:flagellar hook assembly protein FlgD
MSVRRSLLLAVLLAVLFPADGLAGGVRLVSQEVALGREARSARSLSAREAPFSFDMVGLHWRGSGSVWFRTTRDAGAWSDWRPARPESEDLPDRSSAEGSGKEGWKLGNPYWTGASDRIQYRLSGEVVRLRAFFLRIPATAGAEPAGLAARSGRPAIVTRSQWGADESIVRGAPSYADEVRFSVVHHTAGTNSYSRGQAAGIVRGIQRYHVLANGWNDIGYNFLVDKYGRVYEGRAGGVARAVIGAHAGGFNTGSAGVAVLGTYGATRISSAGRAALQRLLAWRLDVAHVDPVSAADAVSFGNERFARGTKVRLRAVSGHRDTGYTSCPGAELYGMLGGVARSVSKIGLPKLYEPEVSGALGGLVRFTGRLSGSRPWRVTVKDGSRAAVAEGSGTGVTVDWTWDSSAAPIDEYTYVVSSGSEVRPARGAVPAPPPLAVTRFRLSPTAISPNGDGVDERARISFSLSVRATVRLSVLAGGVPVRTLIPGREKPAGAVSVTWNGESAGGEPVADRRYKVRVTATTDREEVTRTKTLAVDRALGSLSVTPEAFSPNGDRRRENVRFGFHLARSAQVRVRVLRGDRAVATLADAELEAGRHVGSWDGRAGSNVAADGSYTLRVEATTSLGTRELTQSFTLDTTRPRVRVLSARRGRNATRLRLELSEPGLVRIWYGIQTWADGSSVRVERPGGTSGVWRRVRADVVRVRSWDAAGNRSRAVVVQVRS